MIISFGKNDKCLQQMWNDKLAPSMLSLQRLILSWYFNPQLIYDASQINQTDMICQRRFSPRICFSFPKAFSGLRRKNKTNTTIESVFALNSLNLYSMQLNSRYAFFSYIL